jgi:hypothetical protein
MMHWHMIRGSVEIREFNGKERFSVLGNWPRDPSKFLQNREISVTSLLHLGPRSANHAPEYTSLHRSAVTILF